jgi:hypothetical protein
MHLKGRQKSTFDWWQQRAIELESKKKVNQGALSRHDWWRLAYYKQPYLLLEDDQVILDRFSDLFTNSLDISHEGKIGMSPMMEDDARFARLFTEIIEETDTRRILHRDSMGAGKDQIQAYFENGTPLGVEMFKGIEKTEEDWLLKFSQKEFVDDMYRFGRFRISPASYYAKGSHLRYVKDLEMSRNYRLKAISDVINGNNSFNFQGKAIDIKNGVVPVEFIMDDYYLFCSCKEINRRMPTDFEADSVLIIKNKQEFLKRLKDELFISYPDWEFIERDVHYYDPYNDLPTDRNQEFYKHLAYAYQKEHRCILRPKRPTKEKLKAFFTEVGSLEDIAEVVTV